MHITEPLPGEKRSRLAFGLDWSAYPEKGAKESRTRYAGDFSATHYVEMKVGAELIGGFCAPDTGELRRVKLFSGAARVAMLERVRAKPAVLVLMQDGAQVHLVHVVRGAVRHDEVVTVAAAAKRRGEIAQQSAKLGLPLTVLASGDAITPGDEPFSPAELLQQKKAGRIARVPAGIPNSIVVLLALAIAGFGAKEMWGALNPPPIVNAAPSWSQLYEKAMHQVFAGRMPLASQLAPDALALLDYIDTNRKGWQFEKADCPSTGFCSLTYQRAGGSFEDFARTAPASMQPVTFAPNGLHLYARGPALPRTATLGVTGMKAWPDEQRLIEMLQTPPQRMSVKPLDLKSFGYEVKLEPSHPLLASPPPAGERHSALLREGRWEIDGYRWQAPLLTALPPNMTLESLNVKLDTAAPEELGKVGIHFVAKGKYYVVQ
ncbi:hypothetical protein M3A49_35285 [Paraburkholderia sp. CNPSo 3076]|uniref:hypothetical protein n=1 Tax=Paraburkholderia sp. CNPSo 3076 TaxID=2940936 RepID=UPI0022596700|nr:hypothetical protein [Paraburkholderia sp. CNPSo 3076]MCX5544670.1 hypothetical protein [Paraburkholderia sp. CNPSo 3076]